MDGMNALIDARNARGLVRIDANLTGKRASPHRAARIRFRLHPTSPRLSEAGLVGAV
jgi:hypothetical protein